MSAPFRHDGETAAGPVTAVPERPLLVANMRRALLETGGDALLAANLLGVHQRTIRNRARTWAECADLPLAPVTLGRPRKGRVAR